MDKSQKIKLIAFLFSIGFILLSSSYTSISYAQILSKQDQETLQKARIMVDKKEYKASLSLYDQVLKNQPLNSDLLIEIARVTGWADENKKSAELYNQVLNLAPERQDDVLRAMGWQLLWSNQPTQSEKAFKSYFSRHPTDIEAKKGLVSAYLESARTYTNKGNLGAALIYYNKTLESKPNDSDLLIETARVYGWNNNHERAIALYNRVKTIAPDRKKDILRPLGWQYIWNKQADMGENLFTEYLLSHPDDEDANLGLARALEERAHFFSATRALKLYKKIIQLYPKNIEARYGAARMYRYFSDFSSQEKMYYSVLALKPHDETAQFEIARAHNLMGKNRLAAREYAHLFTLFKKPENQYVIDKAYAESWSGFNHLALTTLGGINNPDAINLRQHLLRYIGNPLEIRHDAATDSDGLDINIEQAYGGINLTDVTTLTATYRYADLMQNQVSKQGRNALIGLNSRFGSLYSPIGTIWPSASIGSRNYSGWNTTAWQVATKWVPVDRSTIFIEAGNNIIENVPSIQNQVLFNYGRINIDQWLSQRILLNANLGVDQFNDDNTRPKIGGSALYTLIFVPKIYAGINASVFSDSNPEINRGYYNPNKYQEHRVISGLEFNLGTLFFKAWGALGRFQENPGLSGPLSQYEFILEKDLKRLGIIRAYYGHSESSPGATQTATNTILGYKRTYWGVSFSTAI